MKFTWPRYALPILKTAYWLTLSLLTSMPRV